MILNRFTGKNLVTLPVYRPTTIPGFFFPQDAFLVGVDDVGKFTCISVIPILVAYIDFGRNDHLIF